MGGKFKKVVSPTLKELFVEQLERMILDGELQPGDKLPTEREMAQDTGVSLAVVHAGVTDLARLGFLRVVPRQGVFVGDYVRDGTVSTLKEVMVSTGMPLSEEMLLPIADLRRSVEAGAIVAACQARTDEDLESLRAIIRQDSEGDGTNAGELGFQFYHGIGLASKNMYFPMMIRTFKPFYVIFGQQTHDYYGASAWVEGTTAQVDAIERRDADKAAALARAGVQRWVDCYRASELPHAALGNRFRFGSNARD